MLPVLRGLLGLYGSPSSHHLLVSFPCPAGVTRGQGDGPGDGPGVGWEDQLHTNSCVPQPGTHTQLTGTRGEQLLGKWSGSTHKHQHEAEFLLFLSLSDSACLAGKVCTAPLLFPVRQI